MKKICFKLFLVLFPLVFIFQSCNKDDDEDTVPTSENKHAWVVGTPDSTGYAVILHSSDGGDTWERQGQGADILNGIELYDVWAVDKDHVWAAGDENNVFYTEDGGQSWQKEQLPSSGNNPFLMSVAVSPSGTVWVSGNNGMVAKQGIDREGWTVIDPALLDSAFLQGVFVIEEDVIYVVGGIQKTLSEMEGYIARSYDNGATWEEVIPDNNFNRNEWIGVKSYGTDHIVIYGGKSHYMYSDDAGQTWRNDSVPNTGGTGGADINCLTMLSPYKWWGAFDYDGIFMTEDAGLNWNKQDCPPPYGMWLFGIGYYTNEHAIISAISSMSMKGKIITTHNAGQEWKITYYTSAWLNKVSVAK